MKVSSFVILLVDLSGGGGLAVGLGSYCEADLGIGNGNIDCNGFIYYLKG